MMVVVMVFIHNCLLLLPIISVHSLVPSTKSSAINKRGAFNRSLLQLHSSQPTSLPIDEMSKEHTHSTYDDQNTKSFGNDNTNFNSNNQRLASYAFHWEALLQREYQDTVAELQQRRKSYTRSQLEASGLALFNAVATPETELYGEKIVRVTIPQPPQSRRSSNNNDDGHKLRDKFKRGDVLVMTPQMQFKGRDVTPREGLVMDVGRDYISLG
jgi:hypothetical protein